MGAAAPAAIATPKPDRPAGGRPSKLTPEAKARILEALESGMFLKHAAEAAGVSASTLHLWIQKGAGTWKDREGGRELPPDPEFAAFAADVAAARAKAVERCLRTITKAAAEGDWRAAAWFLERACPDEWGPREKVEGVPIPRTQPWERPPPRPRPATSAERLADDLALL